MNKSAREMFEDLGYYYRYIKGDCSEDVIQYQDFGKTVLRKEDLAKYNVTNYLTDNSQLENDLSGWIERSYPGLVENLSGDVTIRHPMQKSGFEIKSGDVVKIGGKEYTIGQDGCYLSAAGRTTVCQLAFHNGDNVKGIAGGIILNGMEPTQSELQSLYNPANPLVKLNADGTYALNQNNTAVQIIRDGKVIYSGNC